jgi:hypothetical protein
LNDVTTAYQALPDQTDAAALILGRQLRHQGGR